MRLRKIKSILMRPFSNGERALTLVEIIIVVTLLGTLMTIIVRSLTQQQKNAQEDAAKLAMNSISQSLQMYKLDNGKFPMSDQGLEAMVTDPGNAKKWRGPYIEEDKLKDPWSNPFGYESDGREYKILSNGADGESGSSDDLTFPAADKEEKEKESN